MKPKLPFSKFNRLLLFKTETSQKLHFLTLIYTHNVVSLFGWYGINSVLFNFFFVWLYISGKRKKDVVELGKGGGRKDLRRNRIGRPVIIIYCVNSQEQRIPVFVRKRFASQTNKQNLKMIINKQIPAILWLNLPCLSFY